MIRFFLVILLSLLPAVPSLAQVYSTRYRLPGQDWMELRTERFRVIYPERYREEALLSLSVLEGVYPDIQGFIGGDLRRFPVILNPGNDRSNGFVASFNFRSEVELAPIRGKALNPASGSWLETVLPHELVHALHFNVKPSSLTNLLGLLSPDLRRSVHAAAPAGVLEGAAVYYESHGGLPPGGRGNYPYFTNQFNALLGTGEEWSMGQLLHSTDFTPPFNRHYIGGYHFTDWLQDTYGTDSVKKAVRFHYRYPFLGYGTALRHATGLWPGRLYKEFSADIQGEEAGRLSRIRESTDSRSEDVSFSASCRSMNGPVWVDETSVLFYGRGCNRPPGFYLYDSRSDKTRLLKEVRITEDYRFSLSPDRRYLYYSRYHVHPFYDNINRSDLHRVDIRTGRSARLTKGARLFAPYPLGASSGESLALQTEAQQHKAVVVDIETGSVKRAFSHPESASVVQTAPNPGNPDQFAVVADYNGIQALWLENTSRAEEDSILVNPPAVVFENGSVSGVSWHPSGEKLLFTSDHTGVMNIYEYNPGENSMHQLTQSRYNAFDASYSPSGKVIAYTRQVQNEQVVSLLNIDQVFHQKIPAETWTYTQTGGNPLERPAISLPEPPDSPGWIHKKYRTGFAWLKPRLWMPLYKRDAGFDKFGLQFESADILSKQAASLQLFRYAGRYGFDLEYIYKGFYPGFRLNAFQEPSVFTFRTEQDGEEIESLFLQQSRGVSFKMPVPVRFESNSRFTSFLAEPQYFVSQIRFSDPDDPAVNYSDFGTRHTLGFRTALNLDVRQFTRDMQPNSGWTFFAEARHDLGSKDLLIRTDRFTTGAVLAQRKGLRAGVSTFAAPLSRYNQSLRLTLEAVSQTNVPVFNTSSLFSGVFHDTPHAGANNLAVLNSRYTIPLLFPDDGGLLIPGYLSNLYLVLFSQTAADLNQKDFLEGSRSVLGAGIRTRFRVSNLAFDVGISVGWEPARDRVSWHIGNF